MVAVATGKIDGLIFILGLIGGMFIFAETYPLIMDFTSIGSMGTVRLPELLNIKSGIVVLAVVVMAVVGYRSKNIPVPNTGPFEDIGVQYRNRHTHAHGQ